MFDRVPYIRKAQEIGMPIFDEIEVEKDRIIIPIMAYCETANGYRDIKVYYIEKL